MAAHRCDESVDDAAILQYVAAANGTFCHAAIFILCPASISSVILRRHIIAKFMRALSAYRGNFRIDSLPWEKPWSPRGGWRANILRASVTAQQSQLIALSPHQSDALAGVMQITPGRKKSY